MKTEKVPFIHPDDDKDYTQDLVRLTFFFFFPFLEFFGIFGILALPSLKSSQ